MGTGKEQCLIPAVPPCSCPEAIAAVALASPPRCASPARWKHDGLGLVGGVSHARPSGHRAKCP
eukprot:3692874-Alexandrium_andersonii.AAC.1